MRLAFVALLLALPAYAEMIFLDINNAPQEINYCRAGLDDKARRLGRSPEPLNVVTAARGETADARGVRRSNTYWRLRESIQNLLGQGKRIDSIVISGEDGSGHFFGENGDFYSSDLMRLYEEFPQLKGTLKSAALWGCYPTSVHGAEQFWVNRIPSMQLTMGFTIQGPSKDREVNWDLLRQFCDKREEATAAVEMDQDNLCRFYDSLRQITPTALGLCSRGRVASRDYGRSGTAERCFTYEALHERCGDFIKDFDRMNTVLEQYRQGLRTDFEYSPEGGLSELRLIYNQVQLWRHCQQRFKTERGYDMPYAPDMIRLIKIEKLKQNLMKLNAPQLAQYDVMLNNMGLGDYRLGDLTKLPHREMVQKIQNVVVALERLAQGAGSATVDPLTLQPRPAPAPAPTAGQPAGGVVGGGFIFTDAMLNSSAAAAPAPAPVPVQTTAGATITTQGGLVNGVDPGRALRMAQCLRMTLVNTDHRCTRFSLVSDHASGPSVCVLSYERAGQTTAQNPCGLQ